MSINPYSKDGKKYYEVRVKGRGDNGKQVCRRKAGITSITKARSVELDLREEIRRIAGEEVPFNFSDWHSECLNRMRLELKESTVIGYDGAVKQWLSDEWNKKLLTDFTKAHVHELIYETMDEATANMRKQAFKKLHRIFELAVEEGIIPRNPAAGIKVKVPAPEQLVLNANEAEILLTESNNCNHRFFTVWTFALLTGMRSGEMYAIRWSDIDFEAGIISVKRQWTSKDGLHPTKSNRFRVVPLSLESKKFLSVWKLESGGGFKDTLLDGVKKGNVTHNDYVLPRLREWKSGEQADVLKDFCRGIGITEVKFHDLRATFITNLLAQGVPLVQVMSIVGHSKMSTTDKYLRLAGVGIKGATEKLGYALPEKKKGEVVHVTFGNR
ncbi:MAG: hypothetical protein COW00_01810 [Bdellovibrio sp. CG12_big_fil_rev_8_21_14_0_65_39_13]|nr:MAG: hypothetical protein COW00_01810 [Bdellovibrio sp. CG12_big_fil_rev_8_21_14_0_65_39_13]PIR34278.1 MAG: hypothetical protein COV37_13150 [Bdellovibrio sp. CG11_big_fil_rev_8_21_14_0_20_39_38]